MVGFIELLDCKNLSGFRGGVLSEAGGHDRDGSGELIRVPRGRMVILGIAIFTVDEIVGPFISHIRR